MAIVSVLLAQIAIPEMDWRDSGEGCSVLFMFWLSNPSLDIIKVNSQRSASLEPFKGKIKI